MRIKMIYKIIIFAAAFQFAVIMVNATGVFGDSTFYKDSQFETLRSADSPEDVLLYFFELPDIPGLDVKYSTFTIGALVFAFAVLGAAIAWKTQSWTPIIVWIIGTSFLPMITRSYEFWRDLFENWNSTSLTYLGLFLGFSLILWIIFSIIDTPQGGTA